MKLKKRIGSFLLIAAMSLVFITGFSSLAQAQDYPNKPITLYVGFAAGATTDIVGRSLAAGAEKILGVPIVVEQKAGASATLCAGLVASKKPDGYTLGIVSSDAIMRLPDLIKVSFDPMKDFSFIGQYAGYSGALVVMADSPFKTIEDFIAYAKAHPGMTYASNGINNHQAMSIEILAQCKGLNFKAIPYTGGSEAITSMLGKHVEFLCGAGSHLPYVQQGKFRMLAVTQTEKRSPDYPDIPTLKELGCPDVPPNTQIIIAPKGLPDAIADKLEAAFKKVHDGPEFQKVLKQIRSPQLFKDRKMLDRDMRAEYELYKEYHKKTGTKRAF